MTEADLPKLPLIEPVYPLTEGLSLNVVRRSAEAALLKMPPLPEWQDAAWLAQRGWPAFGAALSALHHPADLVIAPETPAWSRLAYDELLAGQLALALVRANQKRLAGRPSRGDGHLRQKIVAALPYSLTPSQARAVEEIDADLAKPERMLRLLQGDVGAGKTVVALLAAATVVEAGRQAALMAPTEILARQHHKTMAPLAETAGLRLAILTGRERGRERAEILARLASGELDLLVGTHALFQEEVEFRDLALAIVDEQHRFGVHQRLALARKGEAVDVLVLTATPIPRTLVLTYFGDMDVSQLREKPAGRQPIDTRALPLGRIDEVVAAVGRALDRGERVYWVCPLVAESEMSDLAAAEQRFAVAAAAFRRRDRPGARQAEGRRQGCRDGALCGGRDAAAGRHHGHRGRRRRARGDRDGDRACRAFRPRADPPIARPRRARTRTLDLPAALPRAARRNRQGAHRRSCARPRTASASPRRTCACAAKATCSARGNPACRDSRSRRIETHGPLLEPARKDAQLVLARDPTLTSERGEALRHLLYLFDRDEAIRLLRAG